MLVWSKKEVCQVEGFWGWNEMIRVGLGDAKKSCGIGDAKI